jgi:hypothetical protein
MAIIASSRDEGQGKSLMSKKLLGIILATLILALVHPAAAQQTGKVLRIGFLDVSTACGMAVRRGVSSLLQFDIPMDQR